jgi:amino acid transporter
MLVIKRDIPLVLVAYLSWKFFKKTKIVSLKEIPLEEALMQADVKDPLDRSS